MKHFILSIVILLPLALLAQNKQAAEYTDLKKLEELHFDGGGLGYPWLSHDGLRIYYTSDHEGRDFLYVAERPSLDESFEKAKAAELATEDGVISCWLTEDELEMYYISRAAGQGEIHYVQRASLNSPFSGEEIIYLNNSPEGSMFGPSLTPDEQQLFVYVSSYDEGNMICRFDRVSEQNFEYVGKLPVPLEGDQMIGPGQLSKDGLKYYVAIDFPLEVAAVEEETSTIEEEKTEDMFSDVEATEEEHTEVEEDWEDTDWDDEESWDWEENTTHYRTDLYVVSRESVTDEFSDLQPVEGMTGEGSPEAQQPSLTRDGKTMVFIHNIDGTWQGNSLQSVQLNTDDDEEENEGQALYYTNSLSHKTVVYNKLQLSLPKPNPADEMVYFNYELPREADTGALVIYSSDGTEVRRVSLSTEEKNTKMNVIDLEAGTYLCKIITPKGVSTTRKLVIAH